jgi:hypothetical protein
MLNKSRESSTLVSFLTLEEMFSFSRFSMMLAISLSYIALLRGGTFFLLLASRKDIEFCQRLFSASLRWSCHFCPHFFVLLYCIYWFAYVERSLYLCSETDLIMVYNLFDLLLNSVC